MMSKAQADPTFTDFDYSLMRLALAEARKAAQMGNIPVGAVISYQGKILAKQYNQRSSTQDATAHAEILAIREASRNLRTWHLEDCTLYVNLEPCLMCSGAILNSRIRRLVFGAHQPKFGAVESKLKAFDQTWNHNVVVESGLLAEDSIKLLQDFFRQRRKEKQELGGPSQRRQAALMLWEKRRQAEEPK